MTLEYEFEARGDGTYQVRLHGEFVCYTNKKSETLVDSFLKREGYPSKGHYLDACREQHEEDFNQK